MDGWNQRWPMQGGFTYVCKQSSTRILSPSITISDISLALLSRFSLTLLSIDVDPLHAACQKQLPSILSLLSLSSGPTTWFSFFVRAPLPLEAARRARQSNQVFDFSRITLRMYEISNILSHPCIPNLRKHATGTAPEVKIKVGLKAFQRRWSGPLLANDCCI